MHTAKMVTIAENKAYLKRNGLGGINNKIDLTH